MDRKRPLDQFKRAAAGRLRRRTTAAEDRLWRDLRRVPVIGSHFRRQVPIGPYVADFACLSERLVVELDGGHHGEDAQSRRDGERTAWLEGEGYRVLRFWNREVLENLEGVLDTIYAAVHGSLAAEPGERRRSVPAAHPTPPPRDVPPSRRESDGSAGTVDKNANV